MKQLNITIHPFSALAGMALLGLVWVTAGAMPLQGSSSTRDVSAIENVNEPHPRDFVRIVQGTSYTVPAGKLLVIRQMGVFDGGTGNGWTKLLENGVTVTACWQGWMGQNSATYQPGIMIQGGSVVDVVHSTTTWNAGALGFLVDA